MFTEINNWLKNIFSNEETITFTVLLTVSLLLLIFLGEILTPFLISLIFAYLLVGLQTRLENYGMPHWPALIITFGLFLLIGVLLMVWLIPLLYAQIQNLINEIPGWFLSLRALCTILKDIQTL